MSVGKTRKKKERVYRSFSLQKTLPAKRTVLPAAVVLVSDSLRFLRRHWRSFGLLLIFFASMAAVLLFSGGRNDGLAQAKTEFIQRYGSGFGGGLSTSLALLSEASADLTDRLSQFFGWFSALGLFASLSLWWLIRNLRDKALAGRLKVREAVYFGPAQIVPFAALGCLLLFQLLPALVIADFGLQLREGGVLQSNWEQAAVLGVIVAMFALSFYWAVGGLFGLIIVSLPGTKPLQALQTSLQLAHRRRRIVVSRLLILPLLAVPLLAAVLPAVWLLPQWSEHLLYLIGLLLFIISHIYCFLLYQSLLTAKTT